MLWLVCCWLSWELLHFRTAVTFSIMLCAAGDVFQLNSLPQNKSKELSVNASFFEIYNGKVCYITAGHDLQVKLLWQVYFFVILFICLFIFGEGSV